MTPLLIAVLILGQSSSIAVQSYYKLASDQLGIKINPDVKRPKDYHASGATIECTPASLQSTQKLKWIEKELARYPRETLKKSGLREVQLCESVSRTLRGEKPEVVGGLADPDTHVFYISTTLGGLVGPEILHHELFHAIDQISASDWNRVSSKSDYTGKKDNAVKKGFVSGYSRRDPVEDRAEIFSALMTDRKALEKQAAHDPALQAKIDLIHDWLRRNNPRMEQAVWRSY